MNRSAFIAVLASAAFPVAAISMSPSTIVLLSSNVPEIDDDATDSVAEGLRARGVRVVDPSSMKVTFHERDAMVAVVFENAIAVAVDRVSWIQRDYGAARALFVRMAVNDSTLAYGDFTVHNVHVTCSFRCMEVRSGEIVKAGSFHAEHRGEDSESTLQVASHQAILGMIRSAASGLTA